MAEIRGAKGAHANSGGLNSRRMSCRSSGEER